MSDIFVSYANEDRPKAKGIARALEQRGWSVFWDRGIPAGKTWRDVLAAELYEAKCVVVLWSEASVTSRWVLEEAEIAFERGVLLPVRIAPVPLPLGFRSLQAADLTTWSGDASDAMLTQLTRDVAASVNAPLADSQEARPMESSSHSRVPVSFWIATGAYALFAVLLLTSAFGTAYADNPEIGALYIANAILLGWGGRRIHLDRARPSHVCLLGAVGQCVVLATFNFTYHGRGAHELVFTTSALAIGVFLLLWMRYRRVEHP